MFHLEWSNDIQMETAVSFSFIRSAGLEHSADENQLQFFVNVCLRCVQINTLSAVVQESRSKRQWPYGRFVVPSHKTKTENETNKKQVETSD